MQNETRPIYHIDTYARSFTAQVISCIPNRDAFEVILDQTAFYPDGGGQPADQGVLAGFAVKNVQEKDGGIIHILDQALPVGSQVEGAIDWQLRFERMQHHTGEHIVSGIVNKLFGFDNVGFHMGSDGVTIDFSGILDEAMLDQVEDLANGAIYQNLPVTIDYPAAAILAELAYRSKKAIDGAVRIVHIPEIDRCACCGTHTRTTGEVGLIKLIKSEKYKGGTRVTILCGSKALLDYRDKVKRIAALSSALSAKPTEVGQAVDKLLQEQLAAKRQNTALKKQLWEQKAASLGGTDGERAIFFEENLSADDLRQFCQILGNTIKLTIAFSQSGDNEYKYAVRSSTNEAKSVAAALNGRFNGCGGGTPAFCQGSIRGGREEIEMFFKTGA